MPIISVIIPIFNTQDYLKKCLNSVINQTLKDIEIICINDNSTDNSLSILNQYKKQDKRIKIISLNKNKGSSYTRNMGINLSKGEYISFIDSDDYIDSSFYHSLYTKAKTSGAEVIKGNRKMHYVSNDVIIEPLQERIHKNGDNKFFFEYQWTTAIYRKDIINKCNIRLSEELYTCEDLVFLFNVLLNSNKVEYVDDVYYHYVKRCGSLTDSSFEYTKIIESKINARKMILESVNDNFYRIKESDYIMLYLRNLKKLYRIIFQINDVSIKKYAIKIFVRIFNDCRLKDIVGADIFKNQMFLLPILEDNRIDDLCYIFQSKNIKSQFLALLNKNVQKDMSNAV